MNREKKTKRMSLALTESVKERLDRAGDRTKQGGHTLAEAAVEAAIEAIEANDYRLVVPIEFRVAYVPAPNHETRVLDATLPIQSTSPGGGSRNPRKAKKQAAVGP